MASSTAAPSTACTRYARAPGRDATTSASRGAAEQQARAVVDRPAGRELAAATASR